MPGSPDDAGPPPAPNPVDTHVAFNLGWDRAYYGLPCDSEDAEIHRGYAAGRERFRGGARREADRYVRKWLQLRTNAWARGRVFSEAVTIDFLRHLDVERCPVLGVDLTHGSHQSTDWSVDRLNNDGAYAPGNLAVMSTQANRAKGNLSFGEVWARAQLAQESLGLTPLQWLRLAALMEGPSAAGDEAVPLTPFVLRSGRGIQITLPQALQWILRAEIRGAPNVHIVRAIRKTCLEPSDRGGFDGVVKRLRKRHATPVAAEDVWAHPGLFSCFARWFEALRPASRERIERVLAARVHFEETGTDTDGWCLAQRGYYERPAARVVDDPAGEANEALPARQGPVVVDATGTRDPPAGSALLSAPDACAA